jgi:hypothetical protein
MFVVFDWNNICFTSYTSLSLIIGFNKRRQQSLQLAP